MRIPEFKPQVKLAPIQGGNLTAEAGPAAYGAGIGAGLGDVGQAIARAVEEQKRKADYDRVLTARADASRLETLLDADARRKKGQDVINISEVYRERYRVGLQEIESGLSNEDQIRAFRSFSLESQDRMHRSLLDYETKEYDAFTKDEFKNATAMEADKIARAIQEGSFKEAEERVDSYAGEVRTFADNNGSNPDAAEAAWRSEVHAAATRGLFRQMRNAEAVAYYQKHREHIFGDDREQLDQATASATVTGQAIETGDRLYEENRGDVGLALAAARKLEDNTSDKRYRTGVEQRIRQRRSDEDAADDARKTALFNGADAQFRKTWSTESIDRATWSQLSTGQQRVFMDAEYAKRQREASDADPDLTDPGALERWADWTHMTPQQKMLPESDPLLFLQGRVPARLVEAAIEERALLFNPKNPNKGMLNLSHVLKMVKDTSESRAAFASLPSKKQRTKTAEMTAWVIDRLVPNEDGFYDFQSVRDVLDDALIYGDYDEPYWPNPFGGPNKFRFELDTEELENWTPEGVIKRTEAGEEVTDESASAPSDPFAVVPYPQARMEIQRRFDQMRKQNGLPPKVLTESELHAIYMEYTSRIGVSAAP